MAMTGTLTFSACSDDDNVKKTTTPQYLGDNTFKIGDNVLFTIKDTASYSIEQLADLIYGADGANSDEETAARRQLFIRRAQAYDDSIADANGANGDHDYVTSDFIKFEFLIGGNDDENRYHSGSMIFRRIKLKEKAGQTFTIEMPRIKNVYLMEHEFITDNNDAPSINTTRYIAPYIEDDLLVFADRRGYGYEDSYDALHLKAERNAEFSRSYIDHLELTYAIGRMMLDNERMTDENGDFSYSLIDSLHFADDYKMYVSGLSEGAAVALAQHKYFDTHPDKKAQYHFAGSICSNGIYNPAKAFETWVKTNEIDNPLMIPLYLLDLDLYDVNGKYFSDAFEAKKEDIANELASMDAPLKTKIERVKKMLGTSELTPATILSKEALNENSEVYKELVSKLKEYDLTSGWTPSTPIHLVHANNNKTTPYELALDVKNLFDGHAACTLTTTSFTDEELKENAENGVPVDAIDNWYQTDLWKWSPAFNTAK